MGIGEQILAVTGDKTVAKALGDVGQERGNPGSGARIEDGVKIVKIM